MCNKKNTILISRTIQKNIMHGSLNVSIMWEMNFYDENTC
jgi:hypothetical protein